MGIVHKISFPEPPRLLAEPPEPLEPCLLHKVWRPLYRTGEKIEGSAHADRDRRLIRGVMAVNPFLLLWRTHTDEYNIRPAVSQHLDDALVLLLVMLEAVGRRVAADDVYTRISCF
ncbi:hypothetical protein D3C75_597710 [compost metagenome]